MALRNFWLTADVDGKANLVECGPQRKDGGMDVTIRAREGGNSLPVVRVVCRAHPDNSLTIVVWAWNANTQAEEVVKQIVTFR